METSNPENRIQLPASKSDYGWTLPLLVVPILPLGLVAIGIRAINYYHIWPGFNLAISGSSFLIADFGYYLAKSQTGSRRMGLFGALYLIYLGVFGLIYLLLFTFHLAMALFIHT